MVWTIKCCQVPFFLVEQLPHDGNGDDGNDDNDDDDVCDDDKITWQQDLPQQLYELQLEGQKEDTVEQYPDKAKIHE